jgi:AcrR family transcriptional regulator
MPKIVDHHRYRGELAGAALEVFARQGYASVSMRGVAEALGVSTGTLYHYFPTKEALFKAVMLWLVEEGSAQMRQEVADLPADDRFETLFKFVQAHEDYFRQQIRLMLDYQQVNGLEHPEVAAVSSQHRQIVAHLTGFSEAKVTLILGQILGLVLLRMLEGSSKPLLTQAKPLLKWLKEST